MTMQTVAVLALLVGTVSAANWAVLVAGSNSYMNYRHQADVCHAYQLLVKGGVPAENIITMAYDDVAHSSENPFPGKIFNKPTADGTPGVDVYEGCKLDYTKGEVTPDMFTAVLTGDSSKTGGKKVLQSTAEDKVFVNFVDHGGVGIIAFPSGLMHATELQTTLKTMHSKKMYKELVFYMEACESGSMFDGFPTDLNIYVTTAANADESSWGTYCPPNDKVDGKELNSCLGDLYSVNWMENADSTDLRKETLEEQYQKVKTLTAKSHVMQYGTTSFTSEPTSNFEGNQNGTRASAAAAAAAKASSSVDSRDVAVHTLFYQYVRQGTPEKAQALIAEVERRVKADALFAAIAKKVSGGQVARAQTLAHKQCHKAGHSAVVEFCGGYTDYSLKHSHVIVDLCEQLGGRSAPVVEGIRSVCQN